MPARTDLVILRPWRDGSVHAEVPTTTFHSDDDVVATHAYDSGAWPRLTTLCGVAWFGKASASGWRHPQVVDCEACRKLLLGEETT